MIYNFYFSSLIFLAGFSLYSIVHLAYVAYDRQPRTVYLLFAGITLSHVLTTLTLVISYNTLLMADHILWLRINIAFNIFTYGLLPWFFACYSGLRSKFLLYGSAVFCMLLFMINLIQPTTLIYTQINSIERLLLPWGEVLLIPSGTTSIWGIASLVYLILVAAFGFYSLIKNYRGNLRSSTLNMMVAVGVFSVTTVQSMLFRVLDVQGLPPLAPFGFLGMVLIMGYTLNQDILKERNLSVERLHVSETFRRQVFDSSHLPIVVMDARTYTFIDCNTAAVSMYGYTTKGQVLGLTPLNVSAPLQYDEAPSLEKANFYIEKAKDEGSVVFEWLHQRPDGSVWDAQVHLLYFYVGERPLYQFSLVDITERKRDEASIRVSEARYRTVINASNTGVWEYNYKTEHLWCSPEYFEMLGRHYKDYMRRGTASIQEVWHDLLHPDDQEEAVNHFKKYLETGSLGMYESFFRMKHVDGSWVWIWSRGQTLRDTDDRLSDLAIGTHINITGIKRMEDMLKMEKHNFEVVFECSPIAVLILDESSRIIRANATAVELCGGDATQVLHHRPGDALDCLQSLQAGCGLGPDCPLCPLRKGIQDVITGIEGRIDKGEIQLSVMREQEVRTLWLEISASGMLLHDQLAFIVLLDDITDRKKAELEIMKKNSQLEALNKEKEVLIREISHRTKNTMQVIRGIIALQSLEFPLNLELQQLVKNTEERIQSIALVHQMLYKSEDLSHISIKEYIQDLMALLLKSYSFSEDQLTCHVEVEDHKFLLDTAIPLGLVINELTTNALKYAFVDGRKGIFSINLTQNESGDFLLMVSDNGIGVPDGFEFRQCESLGLKLIYSIGELQMLGKMTMENQNGIKCSLEFPSNLYKVRV